VQDADFSDVAEPADTHVLSPLATGLGRALEAARGQGRELFGFAEHEVRTSWLGTSAGVRRRHVQPSGAVDLTGKSHDRSRSTYVSQATRDFSDVDIAAMDDQVRTRLGWQGRTVELGAGRYDTVLPATAVADLMVYLYWSSDGRTAHEGRSAASSAGGADAATACAAATRSGRSAAWTPRRDTAPVHTPRAVCSAVTTATVRPVPTPFVVRVLQAHRRFVEWSSVTTTEVPAWPVPAAASSSPRSTRSLLLTISPLIGRPPQRC